jgi:hypothetical protein
LKELLYNWCLEEEVLYNWYLEGDVVDGGQHHPLASMPVGRDAGHVDGPLHHLRERESE